MKNLGLGRSAVGFSIAVAMLAGCGGSEALTATHPMLPQPRAPIYDAATGSYLYAAFCCGVLNTGGVKVYDPGQIKAARRIVNGAFNPTAVALDRTGTLYVLNGSNVGPGGVSVTEFDRGSTKRSRRIGSLHWATAMALGRSNNLFVANCNTCIDSGLDRSTAQDSVTVYQAKHVTLLRTITQGIHTPSSLAFDAEGNLYVANYGDKHHHPSVTIYGPGSSTVLRTIWRGITYPGRLAFDKAGDLFLTNGAEIVEYAPGSSKILRTITDSIDGPQALALDHSGTLYVANWPDDPSGPGWISVYAPGKSSTEYQIVEGIYEPVALAFDGDGNLCVANIGGEGRVSIYAPASQKPLRSIQSGPLGEPRALGFGSQ